MSFVFELFNSKEFKAKLPIILKWMHLLITFLGLSFGDLEWQTILKATQKFKIKNQIFCEALRIVRSSYILFSLGYTFCKRLKPETHTTTGIIILQLFAFFATTEARQERPRRERMDSASEIGHLPVVGRLRQDECRSAVPESASARLRATVRKRRHFQAADCHHLWR